MARVPKKAPELAVRTGAQAQPSLYVIGLLTAFDVIHWNPAQTAAVMALSIPVTSFIWNLVEQKIGKRWLR